MFDTIWTIYLISEGTKPMYVGSTTKTMEERLRQHFRTGSVDSHNEMHKRMKRDPQTFSIEMLARTNSLIHSVMLERQAIITYRTHYKEGGYNSNLPSVSSLTALPETEINAESHSCSFALFYQCILFLLTQSKTSNKDLDRDLEIVRLRTQENRTLQEIANMFSYTREGIRQILLRQGITSRKVCKCGELTNTAGNCLRCRNVDQEHKRRERAEQKLFNRTCSSCGVEATPNTVRLCADGSRRCHKCAYREDVSFRERLKTANLKSREKRIQKNRGIITAEEKKRNLIAQKVYRDKKKQRSTDVFD